jgi:nicotinamidase-related amidase
MIRQLLRKRRKRILIDIDTQRDFLLADGNACIKNHRRVLANIRRIIAWARHNNIQVISTCEIYPNHNGASALGYCIDGTKGQKKIPYTLLCNRANFAADGNTDLPHDVLRQYEQVILHKRCVDPFEEPRIERLLSEIRADDFIVIGASAEGAVEATALGLLQRGKRVSIIVDAVGSRNKKQADLAFRKMGTKGAKLVETKKLAGASHLKHVGICDCEMCKGRPGKKHLKVTA